VIAFAGGGALDTVTDGQTGVLFRRQDVDCLIDAVRRVESIAWDADELRLHARKFDSEVFREQLQQFVGESIAAHAAGTRFA
jgi:glycosyltransferase involved in cell wall biosynthesis